MKKIKVIVLSMSMLLFYTLSHAEKIEVNKAAFIAKVQQKKMLPESVSVLNLVYTALDSETNTICYYVFNIGDDEGFIIVSGDDVAPPILGYSTESSYDKENLPPNFSTWMENIQKNIAFSVEKKARPTKKVASYWDAYLNQNEWLMKSERAEEPLLTTLWWQRHPYNIYCPVFGSDTSVTGCVATAMAQIMNYHKHPIAGSGIIPSYTTTTLQYEMPEINISGVEYNWDAMLDSYDESATEEEKTAVALLMYHCGASVKMNYTPTGSGAFSHNVARAMPNFFNYDNALQHVYRWNYGEDDEKWMELIMKEIDMKRPVYYAASDPYVPVGHAFVCDGYDFNYFHINWGWGGRSNGYFWLDALTPDSYDFSEQHNVIFGMQPNIGSEEFFPLQLTWGTDLSASKTTVSPGETISFYFSLNHTVGTNINGMLGVALLDENDNILSAQELEGIELLSEYIYAFPEVMLTFQIPYELHGKYFARIALKDQEGWHLMKNPGGYIDVVPLYVGIEEIGEMEKTDKITIYPNPTDGVLVIGYGISDMRIETSNIEIFDVFGKKYQVSHLTSHISYHLIDISDFPSGIYFIRITTDEGTITKKIIKN